MSTAMICVDLDRTLIYSGRHFETGPSIRSCVERYEGQAISFMTPGAADALARLSAQVILVPTTTRTLAQYRRLSLPGAPHRYAVTSNGGMILVNGDPDTAWTAHILKQIGESSIPLETLVSELLSRVSERWVKALRVADGLFCYLIMHEAPAPPEFVESWRAWCADRGWSVSHQGGKLYSVPTQLCKSRAVSEIRERVVHSKDLTPEAPVLAAGDSVLDAALLRFAHAAIRPAHGELHEIGWSLESAAITESTGPSAAKDILDWFEQRLLDFTILK